MYRVDYFEHTKTGTYPCVKYYSFYFLVKWFLRRHPDARVKQIK